MRNEWQFHLWGLFTGLAMGLLMMGPLFMIASLSESTVLETAAGAGMVLVAVIITWFTGFTGFTGREKETGQHG